ncbi:ABC transporter [Salmonella enterica subsp. enterica serovar Oslo]|nr:ABC transporter [Salmonella enterica subsp. enterica serovar Oslo]
MKKIFVFGVLASAIAFSSVTSANSGTINFTGTITSATCTVSPVVGGGVASTIDLGTPGTDLTGAKTVQFSLTPAGPSAVDCLAKTAADVSWSAPNMDAAGLGNSGGSATGVSLQLKAKNATKSDELVTDTNRTIAYTGTGTPAATLTTLNYEAQLVKTVASGTVSAGSFATSASYTVAYK